MPPLVSLLLLLAVLAPVALAAQPRHASALARANGARATTDADRIYLLSLPSLTFTADGLTAARRGTPRKQLHCVGGDAVNDASRYPVRVDCYNVGVPRKSPTGNEPLSPRWHCVTALHRGVRIADWQVRCEGYSYAGDAYVLKDSCWLDYKLEYEEPVADEDEGRKSSAEVEARDEKRWAAFERFFAHLRNFLLVLAIVFVVVVLVAPRLGGDGTGDRAAYVPLSQAAHPGYSTANR